MRRYGIDCTKDQVEEDTRGHWVRYEDAMAEIADLKQQLATCCQLASMSAKQAEAFAAALNEATGVVAGHWENERAR